MQENRTLPREQRRFFIRDCFIDGDVMDSLFVEATKEDYDEWHREYQKQYRKRVREGGVVVFSVDMPTRTSAGLPLIEILSDDLSWEEKMIDDILLSDLRQKLAIWRDWANELLDFYLSGEQMHATKILAAKYGVSEQIIRRRKRELESFVKKYFNF